MTATSAPLHSVHGGAVDAVAITAGEYDVRSTLRESKRKALPDPGASTRDHGRAALERHHGNTPSSLKNPPLGPLSAISARPMTTFAPCSTVRVPAGLLRTFAFNPVGRGLPLTWRVSAS